MTESYLIAPGFDKGGRNPVPSQIQERPVPPSSMRPVPAAPEPNVYLDPDGSGSLFARGGTPNSVIARQFFKIVMCSENGARKRFPTKRDANTFRSMLYRERERMFSGPPLPEGCDDFSDDRVNMPPNPEWPYVVLSVEAVDPGTADGEHCVVGYRPKELGNVESF